MDELSRDALFSIAVMLDLPDLLSFCKSSDRINDLICKKKDIWYRKLRDDFSYNQTVDDPREYYEGLWLKDKLNFKGTVEELLSASHLNLVYHELKELPKEIGNLKNLKTLILRYNQLTKLPKEIGKLKNLEKLDISFNRLKELPDEIEDLENLELLYLNNNKITKLPKEIGELKNLKELILTTNLLTEIPKEIGDMEKLEKLWINLNNITELPKEIANLKNIKYIAADTGKYNKKINDVPEEIKHIPGIIESEYY